MAQKTTQEILDTIPLRYRVPGGAVAVLKDGELVGQRVWGYANLDQRVPLTPGILMPICSITKQFVCALLIDLQRNPTPAMLANGDIQEQFTEKLNELLPSEITQDSGLTIDNLCDMQSGIRDYWVMTTLWGAKPDDEFLVERDCPPMLARTKSFLFEPGTEYSYSNVNFHVLARMIERVTGEPLEKLLKERVLTPAGMSTAYLCPNTAKHPPPCVGYEGNEQNGFIAAVNRMEWSGDAGLVASLNDMIAYEKYLQRIYNDTESWYHTVSKPHTFKDGSPTGYHYGLIHEDIDGVDTLGHIGALRGYRIHRRHALHERLSVVVMFNHDGDVSGPVEDILRAMLNKAKPEHIPVEPSADWPGVYLDQGTQIAITVAKGPQTGEIIATYASSRETIKLTDANNGKSPSMLATVEGDLLRVHLLSANRKLEAQRIRPREASFKDPSLPGVYRSAEVDSTFHCSGEAGMLYGAFDGYLGKGPANPMRYLGDDVWILACPRGLDAPGPGDWTVAFHRDESGTIAGFKIGCSLAWGIDFVKD
ncbi:beta-lactamase/transpeptidase-like protein [Penicillium hispanicum]|uniref:beta-lactamase/transpeptidase-like protein n=1 Tax=Penicillium hispanicum TaxID=1080232 RepID=UPI00253F8E62|nr:beta-lactamase/transpeptidase-like protein [Penicillium hispanicum]KAJ5587139.1 beta-lactamase/transpeptidase-like protein [Penicillium hispanicum]